MLYHRILEESQRIQKQILSTKEKLLSAPKGKLFCAKNGNHFKWYHSLDSKQIYIPKKNRAYAEQLALKKYYSLLLEDLEQELTALNFYLRHPDTGETFYWEHFGMMDNPKYAKNAFAKLQLYATYNLIPSINLITTYETRNHPLNLEIIETILHYYFL